MAYRRWIVAGVLLLVLWAMLLSPTGTAWAQQPPPPDGGEPDDGDDGDDGSPGILTILQNIVHTMIFPIESMTAALKKTIANIVSGAVEDAAEPFAETLEHVIFGGAADGPGEEMYGPAWRVFRNVSIALWPLTLGLIVATAARGGVTGNPVGLADLEEGLIEWVSSVVLTVASAYLIGLGLQLSRGVTQVILTQVWGSVSARTLVGAFFNTALVGLFLEVVPGAAIFFILFMLILGFSLCTALVFAYVARYAILFILISLAPLVLTLGTVRELRWLFWLWLKGLVLMLLLGPANALLLKLAHVAAVSGLGEISSLFGGVVKFLTAAAVLSVLLTIDYAVIKGVFGAIGEIAGKAKATAQQIVAGLVTLGGIVLTGGLAGLGLGAAAAGGAAAAAGGAGGGGAAGTAGVSGSSAAGAGTGGAAASAGTAGASSGGTTPPGTAATASAQRVGVGARSRGTEADTGASATRSALDDPSFLNRMSAMLRTAGHATMSSRSPVVRALSGVARGVGGALGERGRQVDRSQREEQRQAELETSRAEAQERAYHRGWQGLLDANGMSPDEEGFVDVARSLSRLADEYGGQAVRESAPEVVQGMVAARRYGGISLAAQAQAAGSSNPAEHLGSQVEQRLQARGEQRGAPVFPPGQRLKPGAWGPGPGPYDYQVGMHLAGSLGRRGAEATDAYARLAWALRNPVLGAGEEAVEQLYTAAGKAWESGARGLSDSGEFDPDVVWPAFADQAAQIAQSLGLADEQLPGAWLREQAFLARAGRTGRRGTS